MEKAKRKYVFKSDKRGGRKPKPEKDKMKRVDVFLTQARIDELGGAEKAAELAKKILQ